jgi:hypothetical protein
MVFALSRRNTLLYYVCLLFIIVLSFLFYAPCNYPFFNSDHAVHVLMAKDFTFPRDYFYWGQNRLGSLLPMLAHWLHFVIPMHYLYVCSIVQYIFLTTGFVILAKFIKSPLLKLALASVIFFPVNDYNALILIGHPYSSQLFAGAIFIWFLYRLKNYLLRSESFGWKQLLISLSLSLGACLFYFAGIWVSEFNAILLLIPLYYVLFDKPLRSFLIRVSKNIRIIFAEILTMGFAVLFYRFHLHYKKLFYNSDGYDSYFFTNLSDLKSIFSFFFHRLETTLRFRDRAVLENFFNWFILILTLVIIFFLIRVWKRIKTNCRHLIAAMIIVCTVSCILMFLSVWNLRSLFCPRYFTPVYVMYCFLLMLVFDLGSFKRYVRITLTILFMFFGFTYCYNTLISKKVPGPLTQFSDFRSLPKGTLIADYWQAYKINGIATDSLQSLPFDNGTVRNWDWREVPLAENNIYFINNDGQKGNLPDSISQFGISFRYSGVKYSCNGLEVWLYHKNTKSFIIRSVFNNMYWSVNPENLRLYANEPDSNRAERFGIINLKNGKVALKASNGKFVVADQNRYSYLFADSDNSWDWESFELIYTEGQKLNIRSSAGKYLCADQSSGGIIIANRDEAKEWECFEMVRKR